MRQTDKHARLQDFLVQDRLIFPVGRHRSGVTGGVEVDDSYASFCLLASFAGFDSAIALAGDLDDQGGVLEAIPDRVADDRIANNFGPVR